MSSSNISPDQFHEYVDKDGFHKIDPFEHQFKKVAIERLREGDLARPWGTKVPFQPITGPSLHDPTHPSDTSDASDHHDEEFPLRMFVAQYPRTYSPHQAEGSHFAVYRKRQP